MSKSRSAGAGAPSLRPRPSTEVFQAQEVDLAGWMHCLSCLPRRVDELAPWIETELRAFFPFRGVFLAHGELRAGEIDITHSMACGHEPNYLSQLEARFELCQRTSIAWWLQTRQPFCIDPAHPPHHASAFEIDEINRFGLSNIAAHGVVNIRSTAGTYFAFCGVKEPLTDWHIRTLRMIAPVLNDLFLSAIAEPSNSQVLLAALTPRQIAIVRQILLYLDDKSIARKLGISEKTVRNQITLAYSKLGVSKRTELISLLR